MAKSKFAKFLLVMVMTAARIPFALAFSFIIYFSGETEEQTHNLILLNYGFVYTCLGLLIVGELTDFFDGMLARRFGVASEAGAMLDPYADSVSRLIIYWSLASAGLVMPLVPLVMAVRDISITYSRIILSKAGKSVKAKWSGKVKAFVQGVGTIVFLLQPYYWHWGVGKWTVAVGSWVIIIVTVASVIEYGKASLKELGNIKLPES